MNGSVSWLIHPWVTIRVQIALGAIFVAAAIPKIADPPAFAHMIYNYRLVPGEAINVMAMVLPWVELLIGLALIVGVWRRSSALLAGALLLVFIVALGINLMRDHAVNCGCFELKPATRSHAELMSEMRWVALRDVGMLLMVAQIIAAIPSRKTKPIADTAGLTAGRE